MKKSCFMRGFGFRKCIQAWRNVSVDYDITELLELEARFRYFDSNLREKTFLAGSEATKVEPDDFSQIMLGVNFKF